MLIWMIGIVSMATLLGAAAWMAEKSARAIQAPTRWIWAFAIIGSMLLPAATRYVSGEWSGFPTLIPAYAAAPIAAIGKRDLLPWFQSLGRPSVSSAWTQYDGLFLYAWMAMTAGLSIAIIIGHAAWLHRRRHWTQGTLNQYPVYFAPDCGPVVMGFIRPRIVVPAWLKHSPPAQQALVLAHESSHINAHDPQLLTVALALVVLMPWNAPLWWQLLRLRRAVEIDCDARVLTAGHNAAGYGETLLAIGQRQTRTIGTAIAMSESRSFLEERIAIMLNKPARLAPMIAIGLAALAVALAAVATQVAPTSALPPVSAHAAAGPEAFVNLAPGALDAFVGYYKAADNSLLAVTRDNDHLNVQFSGDPGAAAVYPEGATRFFYANINIDAKIEFLTNAQGQAISAVLKQNNGLLRMLRIDSASALQIQKPRAVKIQSHTPSAGSESALRHFIEGILSGRPDLDKLSPQIAGQVAKDLPRLQLSLDHLGGLKSLTFRSVDPNGFDVYDAMHEHGTSEWRVDVDSEGIITGAMFPVVAAQ